MGRKMLRILLYAVLGIAALAVIGFALVYQEFGPIDQEQLGSRQIRQKEMVADFFYPRGGQQLPLVVALSGSGGGFLPAGELQSLALQGYAVLSLAYFNEASLPQKLEEIPLEYFGRAISWAGTQSVADSSRIILLGVSRGAEMALLLASHYPQVKGVVAYAPGSFVLPNAVDTPDRIASRSSWTWQENPLPFAPLRVLQDDNQPVINYRTYIEPLLKHADREAYTIPLEKARCPILLLSGGDDQTWPAAEMATLLEQRLKEKQYPYPVRNVIFPDAGHWLFQFRNNYRFISSCFRIVPLNLKGKRYTFNNGGTAWADVFAKRKARAETLQFLARFKTP